MSFKVGDKVYWLERGEMKFVMVERITGDLLWSGPYGFYLHQSVAHASPESAWAAFVQRHRDDVVKAQARLAEVLAMPMPPVEEG